MPRKKTSNPTKTSPKDQSTGADTPPERTDWDRKLSEARAKRAEVLSARAQSQASEDTPAVEPAPAPKPKPRLKKARAAKKPAVAAVVEAPESAITEAARVKFSLTGAHAMKALFVFCGAVGFGVGTVVGFGILIGMGASGTASTEAKFDASSTSQAAERPIEAAPAPTVKMAGDEALQALDVPVVKQAFEIPVQFDPSPPPASVEVVEEVEEAPPAPAEVPLAPIRASEVVPALPDLLDKDFGFFTEPDGEADLPSISDVRYMRDDLAEIDAVYLRSLPEVDALGAANIPLVETRDAAPEFFMHAPDGLTDAQIRRYVAQLAANGVEVSKIGREGFRVSTTHLRYYSPETADAAKAVAEDLGIPARDFSENAQNPGRIEVWVAGGPKPVEAEEETSKGVFYWLGQGRREER